MFTSLLLSELCGFTSCKPALSVLITVMGGLNETTSEVPLSIEFYVI